MRGRDETQATVRGMFSHHFAGTTNNKTSRPNSVCNCLFLPNFLWSQQRLLKLKRAKWILSFIAQDVRHIQERNLTRACLGGKMTEKGEPAQHSGWFNVPKMYAVSRNVHFKHIFHSWWNDFPHTEQQLDFWTGNDRGSYSLQLLTSTSRISQSRTGATHSTLPASAVRVWVLIPVVVATYLLGSDT